MRRNFLTPWTIRQIVKRYSDFIDHPIVIDVEKETDGKKTTTEETINSRQAIWLKNKSQVKDEEYVEFYKQLARDHEPPLKTIPYSVEGGVAEFKALMFIPAQARRSTGRWGRSAEKERRMDLYARRVLIQHECENSRCRGCGSCEAWSIRRTCR